MYVWMDVYGSEVDEYTLMLAGDDADAARACSAAGPLDGDMESETE